MLSLNPEHVQAGSKPDTRCLLRYSAGITWQMSTKASVPRLEAKGGAFMTRPRNVFQSLTNRALERLGLRPDTNTLLPFRVVHQLQPHAEHHRGVQAIPTEKIVGSVDRHQDFDRHYRRKANHLGDRWARIWKLWQDGYAFPAIQVYHVGDIYFVRDGNHRVSVARTQGQAYIDADVIEIEVLIPPRLGDTLEDLLRRSKTTRHLRRSTLQPVST
jgi:hypothetical protein